MYLLLLTLSLFLSLHKAGVVWNEARFPNVITTVQCSICSQLNNKPRVVVTDFRLNHTCSIIILWLHSLSGVINSLLCNPRAFRPGTIIISVGTNTPT